MSALLTATALPRRARISQKPHESEVTRKRSGSVPTEHKRSAASSISISSEPECHILLVEDNPINRKVIALALTKIGYSVATACDGAEALKYLCIGSLRQKPTAILMDCQMPNVDEQTRSLPVIALTASAIKGDREACWQAGMDDYLTKPAARDALERTLAKWTAKERPHALGYNHSHSSEPR
jgi:CheY-like chemotaxis protein